MYWKINNLLNKEVHKLLSKDVHKVIKQIIMVNNSLIMANNWLNYQQNKMIWIIWIIVVI